MADFNLIFETVDKDFQQYFQPMLDNPANVNQTDSLGNSLLHLYMMYAFPI
jgi:hypothetical protein